MSSVGAIGGTYAGTAFAVSLVLLILLGLNTGLSPLLVAFSPSEASYDDPEGDSYGPGDYVYSTIFHDVYKAEYFDLKKFSIKLEGNFLRIALSLTNVSNPLQSPLGFSPQIIHVYIVGNCENGRIDTLGLNVRLRAVDAWCVCVVIAPNLSDQRPRVVRADGIAQTVDRIYVTDSTIVAEIPFTAFAGAIDTDMRAWRYFVAVSAYDPLSEDKLVRIAFKESDAPVVYNKTDERNLRFLPRVLDVLAKTSEDQFYMLNTYSATHGDIAIVVAYPYAENTTLPYRPLVETMAITTTRVVTETHVKAYYLPGMTTTVVEYVQVPKYGVELYSLALISVALVIILAVILSKGGRPVSARPLK